MFMLGIFVMGVSIIGLVALAFMQARYPDVLESLLLPIEDKPLTQEETHLAEGLSTEANGMTSAASQAHPAEEGSEGINIDEIPVNSVSMPNMTSAGQMK